MNGYVREYRPGKWSYTIYIGKDEKGKPVKREKGGFGSKKEAEDEKTMKLAELVISGAVFVPSSMSLEQLFNEFIEKDGEISRKPQTIRKYMCLFKYHIKKQIGSRIISSIKTKDINSVIGNMISSPKNYSCGYIVSAYRFLKVLFNYALTNNYLKKNPAIGTALPKEIKRQLIVMTEQDIMKLKDLLSNSNCLTPFMIGIYTGLRPAEIVGLRWPDVDFKRKTIHVQRQLKAEKGHHALDAPKTCNSDRVLKINDELLNYLKAEKEKQEENKKNACEFWQTNKIYSYFDKKIIDIDDFVNIKANGACLTTDSLKYIKRVAAPAGIDFYPYIMRHTHATVLIENGASLKLVQERLGHSKATTTLAIYSHVTPLHESTIIDALPVY